MIRPTLMKNGTPFSILNEKKNTMLFSLFFTTKKNGPVLMIIKFIAKSLTENPGTTKKPAKEIYTLVDIKMCFPLFLQNDNI